MVQPAAAAEQLSSTFAALADPTRRSILARLASGEATVTQLAEPFKVSLPAISKHLKALERAGLLVRGRAAQWRPGGAWRGTMVSEDDASEIPFRGTYGEGEEPERLVLTFEDVNDPSNKTVEVLTVPFTDLGGKTEVVAHQAGNMPEEQYRRLEDGYATFFDQLAEHLKQE